MTPIEYVTIAIAAAVVVTRIVIFVRNPSITTPSELRVAEYTKPKAVA
ncbi:hypothetical protein [Massilia rhizosphaerae]|nr:hypothetical protein [Massilia rhizosphaerae]